MAITPFENLTFAKVWTSSSDFPTVENSEAQVRADLQYHPNAILSFLNNNLITKLTTNFNYITNSVASWFPKASASQLGAVKIGSGLNVDANGVLSIDILSKTYPVGAIYMSVNSTSPATLFGGTWEQIQGKFLLSADSTYTAGSTGGEATHTLLAEEMPSHTHTGPSHTHTGPSHTHTGPSHSHSVSITTGSAGAHTHTVSSGGDGFVIRNSSGAHALAGGNYNFDFTTSRTAASAGSHTHSVSGTTYSAGTGATGASGTGATGAAGTGATGSAGSGAAHNNMPPYLAVYMWKRTA